MVSEKVSSNSISQDKYVTTDTMLQNCAGIRTYTGTLPSAKITKFVKGDILISNIRPYLKKLWFATFSGGCSNDVIVLRVKDNQTILPDFCAAYLKHPRFFEYIMQDVSGVKMPRGKKAHIMRYVIPKLDIGKQREFANHVQTLEVKIAEAQNRLEELSGKTADVLNRYLN